MHVDKRGADRIPITKAQAEFLANLKIEAERAQAVFAAALNAVGLAVDHNPNEQHEVSFDFGAEPWIQVKPKREAGNQ